MKDPLPWPNKPVDWNTRTGGYAKDMLLRDYFAAKALQGLLATDLNCAPEYVQAIADSTYVLADAMLKAREA